MALSEKEMEKLLYEIHKLKGALAVYGTSAEMITAEDPIKAAAEKQLKELQSNYDWNKAGCPTGNTCMNCFPPCEDC